ncbi:anthrone oxygenase family protein [Actinosynnema sp. NPDC023658]|uniref:anthrone oxygenase family protein n=1 Tax=Actinosynnema sp. NPDC023658 TaxID=3155465 RepID=UPI0033FEDB65
MSYWQAVNRDYGRFMPPLFAVGVLASSAVVVLGSKKDAIVLVAGVVAAVAMLAGIVLTVTTLVPLNVVADGWVGSIPDSWSAHRDAWRRYHLIRTVVAAVGFAAAATVPVAQLR